MQSTAPKEALRGELREHGEAAPPRPGVYLEGKGPIQKGTRIFNHQDGRTYKVTAVRPNGKITAVCKKTGVRVVVCGRRIE